MGGFFDKIRRRCRLVSACDDSVGSWRAALTELGFDLAIVLAGSRLICTIIAVSPP